MSDQEKVFIDNLMAELPYAKTKDLVEAVQKILDLKKTAVYNRLQHRVNFSLQDLLRICEAHHISLDNLIYKDKVDEVPHSFYSDALRSMPRTYMDYITNINNHVQNIGRLPNPQVTIMLNDFSILHLMGYDYLMYLRLFVWNLASWNMTDHFEKYEPNSFINNNEYRKAKTNILDHYNNTPTYEIWTPELFENLIKLVKFVKSTGIIGEDQLQDIKKDMLNLYKNVELSLNTGKKISINLQNEESDRMIWLNETIRSNELMHIQSDVGSFVFTMYDSPNYIRTRSQLFCKHTYKWLGKIKEQSTEITQSAKLKKMALLRKYHDDIIDGFS